MGEPKYYLDSNIGIPLDFKMREKGINIGASLRASAVENRTHYKLLICLVSLPPPENEHFVEVKVKLGIDLKWPLFFCRGPFS